MTINEIKLEKQKKLRTFCTLFKILRTNSVETSPKRIQRMRFEQWVRLPYCLRHIAFLDVIVLELLTEDLYCSGVFCETGRHLDCYRGRERKCESVTAASKQLNNRDVHCEKKQ